eukprot:5297737-Pyramimonas_sp.AAC.1
MDKDEQAFVASAAEPTHSLTPLAITGLHAATHYAVECGRPSRPRCPCHRPLPSASCTLHLETR